MDNYLISPTNCKQKGRQAYLANNQNSMTRRHDAPYDILFKPNSKKIKLSSKKQEELNKQHQFLLNGHSSNFVYSIGDFNSFANQKIKEIKIEGFKKPMEQLQQVIGESKKNTDLLVEETQRIKDKLQGSVKQKIKENLLRVKSKSSIYVKDKYLKLRCAHEDQDHATTIAEPTNRIRLLLKSGREI